MHVSVAQRLAPDLPNRVDRIGGMRRTGIALLVAGICAACGSSHRAPPPLHVADAYVGLSCGDAFPCPHLGIAVWLKAPQSHVTVVLHGRRVTLVTNRRYEYRRYWQGFVRDRIAERMAGNGSRAVHLTVEATSSAGAIRHATLLSEVSPGWG
jgi:hypothetical protein